MKWVTAWGTAQSTVSPSPATYAKDLTLRYPIFMPFNGKKIRITLDNFCCDEAVQIKEIGVSFAMVINAEIYNFFPLKVKGNTSFTIPAHGMVVTDELEIDIEGGKFLVISFYLEEYTKLTSGVDIIGPLSKGYYAYGMQHRKLRLDMNTCKATSWVYLLAGIDVYTDDKNEAVICYGDSITSQDWPDYMLLDLMERGINNVSVVRKAVSGTRVLREYECIIYQSYGLCGKKRFNHEVSSVCGAKKIIIQHGINDIIHPVGTEVNIFRPMSDLPTKEELIAGLKYYKDEALKNHLEVYFGTLLPIYNWRTFADFRETLKNEVNDWIKTNNFIDFAVEVGHFEGKVMHFNEKCDSGDHLHPSKYAYDLMGKLASKKLYL